MPNIMLVKLLQTLGNAQWDHGEVRGRAAPEWGHLNCGGRAGAELQPAALQVFGLAVGWTKASCVEAHVGSGN